MVETWGGEAVQTLRTDSMRRPVDDRQRRIWSMTTALAICGDRPDPKWESPDPEPYWTNAECTLPQGHPGQLHEYRHPTHPPDWPPVRRWWRCLDGSVIG